MCPGARQALVILEAHQYEPIAAQYGVGVRRLLGYDLRSCSWLDLLCRVRGTTQLAVAEVKACESHYYEQPSRTRVGNVARRLCAPYADRLDHPRNQHQLQVGFSLLWLRQMRPDLDLVGAFVLRVHSTGGQTYPLEDWVLEPRRLPAALAALATVGRRGTTLRPTTSSSRRRCLHLRDT